MGESSTRRLPPLPPDTPLACPACGATLTWAPVETLLLASGRMFPQAVTYLRGTCLACRYRHPGGPFLPAPWGGYSERLAAALRDGSALTPEGLRPLISELLPLL